MKGIVLLLDIASIAVLFTALVEGIDFVERKLRQALKKRSAK